jgi:hypothetical protein
MVIPPASLRILAALTALLVFGSRWFSYIGVSPIFISDVLLSIAILSWLLSKRERPSESSLYEGTDPAKLFLAAILLWAALRALLSWSDGYPILEILRDFVPFVYISIAFVVASQIRSQGPEFRAKCFQWIYRGLGLHLVWCLLVIGSGNLSGIRFGTFPEVGLFAFRADIDTALVAVYFVLAIRRWFSGYPKAFTLAELAGCATVLAFSPARSSLIALLVCVAWFLTGMARSNGESVGFYSRRNVKFSTAIVGTIILAFILQFTTAGTRLLGGLGLSSSNSDLASSALGTVNARELVWRQVLDWVNSSSTNIFFGSGFGINFLDVTRTLQFLEGTTYTGVRSPHNFLVTVIARLGWPAAVILTVTLVIIVIRFRKSELLDDLSFVSMTIVLAFIPISLLGVILEAPFGAIPFYFSIGVLLGSHHDGVKLSVWKRQLNMTHKKT